MIVGGRLISQISTNHSAPISAFNSPLPGRGARQKGPGAPWPRPAPVVARSGALAAPPGSPVQAQRGAGWKSPKPVWDQFSYLLKLGEDGDTENH